MAKRLAPPTRAQAKADATTMPDPSTTPRTTVTATTNPKDAIHPPAHLEAKDSGRAVVTPGARATAVDDAHVSSEPKAADQPDVAEVDRIANLEHVVRSQALMLDRLTAQQARDEDVKLTAKKLPTVEEATKMARERNHSVLSKDGWVMPKQPMLAPANAVR